MWGGDLKSDKGRPLPLLLAGLLCIVIFLCMAPAATSTSYTKYATTSGTDGFGSPEKVQGVPNGEYADSSIKDQYYIWGDGYATETGTISSVVIKVYYMVDVSASNDTLTLKYSLDSGSSFGATQSTWVPTDTTWTERTLDVSGDRTWSWTDISNLRVYLKCDKVAAPDDAKVYVDAMYVTVTTNEPPSVPVLPSPSDNSSTIDNTPTFQWQASTDPESDSITYDLQVDDDSGFGSPTVDETGLGTTSYTPTSELSPDNYYWRVRAVDNNNNQSSWSSSWSLEITPAVGAFDFSVGASPTSLVVQQGSSTSTTVTVTLVSGSAQIVSLNGSWIGTNPSGVTPTFSPSSGTPTYTSTLTFSTTASASTGSFTYRVSGQDGGLTRTVDVTLQISETAVFDFSVSASPDSITLARGYSDTSTISVGLVSGTAQSVSLSGAWVGTSPTGISASFSPQSATPSFFSTLTLTASSAASAGTFTYRVTGQDGSLARTDDITVTISTELTLTLATDEDNYDKGQTIQISGTAADPKGNTVSSGTTTIQLSYGDWSWENTVQISNGAYSDNFQISFGHPEGTWTIEASVTDSLGNSGSTSKNIGVTTPAAYAYYTVQIQSPVAGLSYLRGSDIDISVKVTESGANVDNAEVSLTTPTGESIVLNETSPGTYTGRYSLEWDDPEGTWSVSVEGKKTVDNTFKAGGGYINIEVKPATLQVALLSPTERKFEVGESITVSAEVSYPDGAPVEDVTVSATTPAGETLTLAYESDGVYSAGYVVTEQDVGSWALQVSAADLYGNSGSKTSVISVVPMGTVGILTTYWWAVLGGIVAAGVASAFVTRRVRLAGRLKRITKEKREINRLMKETETRYYKEGSITRDTFDELIRGYEARMAELNKEEGVLKAKVKKVKKGKVGKRRSPRR